MPRQRRLWVSDVVVLSTESGLLRVPVISTANNRAMELGYPPAPAAWIAPNMTGPQLFVGVAGLSPEEAQRVTDLAAQNGFGFLSMALPDADLNTNFGPQARTQLNALIEPEGLAAVQANESKRAVILRIVRSLDAVADAATLIAKLRSHPDVDPLDPGTD